ncbi:MAG: nucleotidyltransferase family protein [Clostridia bacterium]|nr:nucleotidyltransferase family protein [Clostridia bacterium]
MTKNCLDFIHLFRCAIHNSAPDAEFEPDIEAIKTLADRHNAWPLIFMVLKDVYKDSDPCANWADYRNKFFFQCVKNMQHMYGLRKILAAFDKAGIPYAILKGESLAELYPHPECRISSDIDLFVYPADEARAVDVLLQNGVTVEPRIPHAHHCDCKSNACGKIELHIKWQGDLQNDILYNSKMEPSEAFIQTSTEALGKFCTIGVNDGLYFHFAHLMTHFIGGGFGIRLISDFLLYVRKNKDNIDEAAFRSFAKELGYSKFIDTLFGIGVKYLGFNTGNFFDFAYDEEAVDMLMADCLSGGAFGHAEAGRIDTHDAYLKERADDFAAYHANYRRENIKEKLSFSLKNLKHRYHYLRKSILLLPIAYVHHVTFILSRIAAKLFKKKRVISSATPMHENAQKRQVLFDKLELKQKR